MQSQRSHPPDSALLLPISIGSFDSGDSVAQADYKVS
jgi:hypothetical protein